MMYDMADGLQSRLADAAVAEYLEAIERGAPPDLEEFLTRHANAGAALREFLADYQAIERLSPRLAPATAASAHTTGRTPAGKYPRLELPRVFGNFELLEEIARGGMGIVYKARQSTPVRTVALKMILAGQLASDADVERFYAEAQAVATLDHANIVPVFEVGNCEGQHYFSMGYVEGESLSERLARGPLMAREAAAIIRDVAGAVHYAHQRGIIHRDLKPANILVDQDGRVRVTDFGLARRQTDETRLTHTGQLLGTPNFMPPEHIAGRAEDIGPAADVYSLGATLYAILTGRPPFQAASMAGTLRQVAEQEPVALRQLDVTIPRDLETIALKCLEKSPSRRYATAQSLADDLERFLTDRAIVARRSTQVERFVRWGRRNPLAAGLTAALAVLIFAAVSVLAVSNSQIRRESAARAAALQQKDAALATARDAVNQMLTDVASEKFNNVPIAHPLRLSLLKGAFRFYEHLMQLNEADRSLVPEMAQVLYNMAGLQRELGQKEDAERSLRRGIELLSATDERDPVLQERMAIMELDLAYTMDPMNGSLQSAREEDPAVEARYQRALEHLRDLHQRWPERRQAYVLYLNYNGDRAYKRGDLEQAEQLWREAIANGEACLSQRPDDLNTRIGLCRACMGILSRIQSGPTTKEAEAEAIIKKGLAHVEIALQQEPRFSQARDVAASLNFDLALCYCRSNRVEGSIPLFNEAAETMELLCADFPWTPEYWNTLQWFIGSSASSLKDQGRLDEAQGILRGFSNWVKQVHATIPRDRGPREFLRQSRMRLVKELRSAELNQEAEDIARLDDY
jgi:tRNA A-37 threonylcarbamoyl transferase component Bud32/tetratricopeptide (TPR) repeat protein